MRVEKSSYSRRNFLKIGARATTALVANEGIRWLTGVSLESLFSPLLLEDIPLIPFSPAFMHYYFQAECSPRISSLKQIIIKELKRSRPDSIHQLLELSLEKTNSPQTSNETRVRSALFTLAAIGQVGPENDEARLCFPLYLPEGKDSGRPKGSLSPLGLDKTIHFTSAAFLTFELLRLRNKGIIGTRKADEFIIGLERAIQLVGVKRINEIKEYLKHDPKRSFPFPPEIHGLIPEEADLATLITDGGIAFEVFTIPDRPEECLDPGLVQRGAKWIARQRLTLCEEKIDERIWRALKEPQANLISGLGDVGVNGDLAANGAGIFAAIDLFRQVQKGVNPLMIPTIPFDDHAERYGPWQGQINSQGELIGELPQPYPQVSDYTMGFNLKGEIESSVTF